MVTWKYVIWRHAGDCGMAMVMVQLEADAKSIQLIKKSMIQKFKTCRKFDETIMHNQETHAIQCTYSLQKKTKRYISQISEKQVFKNTDKTLVKP